MWGWKARLSVVLGRGNSCHLHLHLTKRVLQNHRKSTEHRHSLIFSYLLSNFIHCRREYVMLDHQDQISLMLPYSENYQSSNHQPSACVSILIPKGRRDGTHRGRKASFPGIFIEPIASLSNYCRNAPTQKSNWPVPVHGLSLRSSTQIHPNPCSFPVGSLTVIWGTSNAIAIWRLHGGESRRF
jgi:hypothetical protein